MNAQDRKQREAMHGENYVHRFSHGRQHARVARLVDRIVLPPQARVLDAGCGTGLLAELLASRCASYTGVDFSQAMIDQARERAARLGLRGCEFVRADLVDHMRANGDAYDAVFMLDISGHVPDAEWSAIVAAAWHALRPGGRVYLHTPNLDFVVERLKQAGWMRQFPEHIAVRDAESNARFFRQAGFSRVECSTLPHYNVLRWLHPLSAIPGIGRYFAARLWIEAVR